MLGLCKSASTLQEGALRQIVIFNYMFMLSQWMKRQQVHFTGIKYLEATCAYTNCISFELYLILVHKWRSYYKTHLRWIDHYLTDIIYMLIVECVTLSLVCHSKFLLLAQGPPQLRHEIGSHKLALSYIPHFLVCTMLNRPLSLSINPHSWWYKAHSLTLSSLWVCGQ